MTTRGRPREFDVDEALDRAIELFWRQGYDGTTLSDLTSAMGINRPSLYRAFGSKEGAFTRAVDRYAAVDMAYVADALAEPTAYDTARRYLFDNVEAITTPGRPPGCLSIQGALASGPSGEGVVRYLQERRDDGQARFARRFAAAIDAGDLDATEDPDELARYITAVSAGMAVQAAAGASREALHRVASRALRAFPGSSPDV